MIDRLDMYIWKKRAKELKAELGGIFDIVYFGNLISLSPIFPKSINSVALVEIVFASLQRICVYNM